MEEVRAPMSGNVWKIDCAEGDTVSLDDAVIVMEVMKMEAEVFATADGTVAEIKVKEGQAVEEGDLLITINT
ncbi:MAG: acetyl-CoA carboxylase biotin carboxyl carrier protein subunit [Deltaproteobacteria bacterium]|nr:MAG: acetyl-CoA carboxylase biotin carboxyl carrier protein subunit [Deltaproteobacteria bacterium]